MDEEDEMYDVVSSKNIVPPEGESILDVGVDSACRALYKNEYYRAVVVNRGK